MNSAGRADLQSPESPKMLCTTSVESDHGPSFMIDDLTYHYGDGWPSSTKRWTRRRSLGS